MRWGMGALGGYLMTTQIFPETDLRVQDDVLTRISATDLDGCGDRHPGCLRTSTR